MKNFNKYDNLFFSSKSEIEKIQNILLKKHISYCYKYSKYYKRILKDINVSKININTLNMLPFTEKKDIEKYNNDFCCVSSDKIIDIVFSSGTTALPTKIMYTNKDLERLSYNEKQAFKLCGITCNDIVLLTCTLDRCFIAGLAYFLGLRELGASIVRNGNNSLESHYEVINRINPSVLVGVPSFLRKLGKYLQEKKKFSKKTNISKIICIGEPLKDKDLNLLDVASDLENIWKAKVFSTYASTETITTFCECKNQKGGHLIPDLAIVEIIDEENNVLPYADIGEIVVTPLQVEGMPLIRFKTGDIGFLINKKCLCGRNTVRLGPVLGRKNQMMKIKGTSVYPGTLFAAIEKIKQINEYYIVVYSESALSDKLEIYISTKGEISDVSIIAKQIQAKLRIKPKVFLKKEEEIIKKIFNKNFRKPIRFIDRRQK